MISRARLILLAACAALLVAPLVRAYDQPAVNLGFTSFLDGIPPAGPGWYAAQYGQYYSSDKLPDLPFPGDPKLDACISLTQLIYQSDKPIFGGASWGLDLILPYVRFDLDAAGTPLTANDGFGDLLVGPYLQWAPVMGKNGPVFVHRVELQTILPTGDYDRMSAINPGSNVVSLNPYWSATWFVTPKWTVSGRFHSLWNDENDDPNLPDPAVIDTRAGDVFHANFATEYEVIDKQLRLGVNGYVLHQISESEVNGRSIDGGKEKVLAVGPGALWSFNPDNHLFMNVFVEMDAENRPEGERYGLRYVHHF